MYRCQQCQAVVGPAVPEVRVVVETRAVTYPPRRHVNRVVTRGRERWVDDPGGTGVEVVRELRVCRACAQLVPD
jgi:hypothetical protein